MTKGFARFYYRKGQHYLCIDHTNTPAKGKVWKLIRIDTCDTGTQYGMFRFKKMYQYLRLDHDLTFKWFYNWKGENVRICAFKNTKK